MLEARTEPQWATRIVRHLTAVAEILQGLVVVAVLLVVLLAVGLVAMLLVWFTGCVLSASLPAGPLICTGAMSLALVARSKTRHGVPDPPPE